MSEWIQLDIEEWISSQEDFPVSPTVSQESKTQKTTANSGLKCLELLRKSNPPTSLERMSEILLASDKEWYSNKCELTWKVKATKCRRLYYLLQQSTHRTKDTDVGFWPTPTTQDGKNNGGKSQHRRNSKPLNAEVGGALNPQWVEWLMGYPIGGTALKD